ncbi:MAG: TIGR00730 family Rossman fold protein [Clostridia bacterium]|nr:TIGR00730 family Rossman fold protein [Clostridia bacterium]
MKICIFGASSAKIDGAYISAVEDLGEKMAKRGHSLVYGAGATGVMGASARGVIRGGGEVHGVIPVFFREESVEKIFEHCTQLTYTDTMAQRKTKMEDEAEAFIIAPGGIGTLEEFYEVLTLKQLGRHSKPIAMFNICGYYDGLESFMREMSDKKFMAASCHGMYKYFTDADALLDYLESYSPDPTPWHKLKDGE